jgi:sugar lactone lactonase YvrE
VVERLNLERHVVEELSLVSGVSLGDSGRSAQVVDVALHENNLFAADALGHQVLRMDLDSGRVDVLAGSGAEGFSGDGGPATHASLFQPGAVAVGEGGRTLFIADAKNHRVRQVTFAPPKPNPEEPNPEK